MSDKNSVVINKKTQSFSYLFGVTAFLICFFTVWHTSHAFYKNININGGAVGAESDFVPGVIVLKLDNSSRVTAIKSSLATSLVDSVGKEVVGAKAVFKSTGKVGKKYKASELDKYFVVNIPRQNKQETLDIVKKLKTLPGVILAEPDYIAKALVVPNDPYFPPKSGDWGQLFPSLWGLQNINVGSAWDLTLGEGQIVAVVDTGVDYNHPELLGKVINGYDYINNDFDSKDDYGHGTHVAGTIAATINNGIGIVGVAPSAKIMAVKVLDKKGNGSFTSVANGIRYAVDRGATVINLSLGGTISPPPQIITDVLKYAHDNNVVVVAAAGNDNKDVDNSYMSPANDPNVITVAASDHNDVKASFSNFGSKIAVIAPGGGDTEPSTAPQPVYSILSLLGSGTNFFTSNLPLLIINKNLLRLAGTSMATPHVAGVAALVRALHPTFGPEQVRQAIEMGSDDIGPPGFDLQYGYGRLNARKSLEQNDPLAVHITQPTGLIGGTTASVVPVYGTVNGVDLDSWQLQYGIGDLPNDWLTITSGNNPIVDDLIANWQLTDIPDSTIIIRLTAQKSNGDVFEYRQKIITDLTAPVIVNITNKPKDYSTAITWITNEPADTQVEYGLTTSYGSVAVSFSGFISFHGADLTGLSANTSYHYRVKSRDQAGNLTVSDDMIFTTTPPTPPVISQVSAGSIKETEASISWNTDELADSSVEYGLTTGYGLSKLVSAKVYSRTIKLINLTPGTTYHYRVKSKDVGGNLAISGDYTFTTAESVAPVITKVIAKNITELEADVNWITNEAADGQVEYGLTNSYGSASALKSAKVTIHSIRLTNLSENTLYHYRVKSRDAGGALAVSGDYTFTTTIQKPPVISNIKASSITSTGAKITWTTNEVADTQIEYGLSATYGSQLIINNKVYLHAVNLTRLTAGVTYHYRVKSKDPSSNLSVSGDYSFTTIP